MIPMDSNMALYVVDTSVIGNTFPSLSAFLTRLLNSAAIVRVLLLSESPGAMTVSLLGTYLT